MDRIKELENILQLSNQKINLNIVKLNDTALSKDYKDKIAIENIKINNAVLDVIFNEISNAL